MDDSGKLVAIIGDEDTVVGFILAGVGHRTTEGQNFLIVKTDTEIPLIEETFKSFSSREDVGIILINQHVCDLHSCVFKS
jgi:V-type H+-transporting ATPase subunit F